MINTSAEYKTAILNNRILHHEATIEFTDGTTLTPKDIDLYTFKITENTSNQNSFDIGSVIAKQLNLKISNIDGEYNQHKFSGAKITARVGLEISGRTEWLKKGVYYAEPGSFSGDTISVTAYDSIMKFDTPYSESTLKYPATLGEIVRDACNVCDVTMSADLAIFSQSSLVVQNRPSDSSLTFRQVLQCVGEISCLFFKMDEDDRLTASWYDTDLLESEQLEENAIKIEHYTGTVETDDVVITGVRVTEESSDENTETNYEYGTTGYVLEIKENKLIQTGSGASVAENVGKKINGLIFRPLSIKCQGDPAREAGDIAVVTDRKGNKYKTILTGVTYTAKAQQDLICGAESPAQQSATRYSKATQVYRELRKTIRQQRTEFVKALESLQNAMDEKEGLHPVTEELEDGSRILYFCDHATLEESKVVIKLNAEGWGMSTDGGKTWNVGALVDGTTITKILNAIGINADWINTGSLSGKYIDARGLVVLDSEGKNATFKVTEDGKIIALPEAFLLSDKSIDQTIIEKASEEAKKMTNLQIILSNENQGVSTNADGSYTTFPACSTTLQVLRGAEDITAEAEYTVIEQDISGSWDVDKHTYTVTGISADSGYVDFLVKYKELSMEKRFTVTKQKQGTSGADAVMYYTEANATVVIRSTDGTYVPETILFKNYKKTGANAALYSSNIRVQTTADGSTFTDIKTALLLSGQYTLTLSNISEDVAAIRYILEDNSLPRKTLAVLTIPVINDAELTEKQIFNILTDNGTRDLLTYVDGKLYLNGTYIKGKTIDADKLNVEDLRSVAAAIAQWLIKTNYIQSKNGNIVLYSDGRLKIGSSTFQKNSGDEACVVKYGLHIYCKDNSTEDFSDGSGMLFISGLTSSTSGTSLVLNGRYVYKLSSSSKRYKDHVAGMTIEEAEKLLKVPVVWFKYRDGYLHHGDRNEGKAIPGFYAEDVAEQFPEGVVLNDDDQIEDWNYRTMIPAMLKIIQNQNERINKLEQLIGGQE